MHVRREEEPQRMDPGAAAFNDVGINILSLRSKRSLKAGAILLLLFPTADAAPPSSITLTLCDTVIPGIFVALALCIALPKRSKSCFFNSAYFRYSVGLIVAVVIMNWFAVQPALNFALGVIGLVIHWLWNKEVKQDGTNQLMGKMWNWINIYGTKLKKFDHKGGSQDDYGGEEDVVSPLEDHGYNDEEDGVPPVEDYGYGSEEDSASPLEEDRGAASADSDNDIVPSGPRAVQVLRIRANFRVYAINGYDCSTCRCIYYRPHEREVQEEGMVDLVPTGPRSILLAYGILTLDVFHYDRDNIASHVPTTVEWDVCGDYGDEELAECTESMCCRGGMLEITYLVIPHAIETDVEVKLNFKDLGSQNRAVYGKIMASTADYGNKRVYLFSCERGRSWSVPSGPITILPLSPRVIALPHRRQLELHIEVDLTVITIFENQEEYKNLKFSLTFTPGIRKQEREADGDQVEVSITFDPEI